jgi:hypothetical protein
MRGPRAHTQQSNISYNLCQLTTICYYKRCNLNSQFRFGISFNSRAFVTHKKKINNPLPLQKVMYKRNTITRLTLSNGSYQRSDVACDMQMNRSRNKTCESKTSNCQVTSKNVVKLSKWKDRKRQNIGNHNVW